MILQRAENPEENDHQDETSPEEGKDEEREKDNSQTSFQAEQDVLAASHQWNESNQADAISAGALSRGAANRRILATNDGREALVEALNRASVSEGNERERIERESNEREIIERVRGGGDQQERQQLIIIRDAVRDENQGGQQNQENLDEQRQQNQDDNPNHLVGRRVIMLDERAAMWKFGSVHSVVSLGSRPDEAVLKVQYADGDSANFRLSELLPSLRPINAAEDNITQGANKVLWKGIFRKFKLVREKLLQGRDFEITAQDESFIRELLNKPTGVLTHATVKTKFKELWNMYHPDKYSGKNYPKRYIYAISAVLHATRYTCELYEYNAERGSERPTISKPKLVDYPEYGSEDYKSKADMMADEVEEIFSQEEPIPRHRRAEPQENPEERHRGGVAGDNDAHERDNIKDDPWGEDIPYDPTTERTEDKFINEYYAVDDIDLRHILANPFKQLKFVPHAAGSIWREGYKVAMARLSDAIESTGRGKFLRTRRALAWYTAYSALTLREPKVGKGKPRAETLAKIVILRVSQFINEQYGILLDDWWHDWKIVTSKQRKNSQDTQQQLLVKKTMKVKKGETRSISKAVTCATSHGSISVDNEEVNAQMRSKFGESTGRWDIDETAANKAIKIELADMEELIDELDLDKSAGPRGFHPHYLHTAHRAKPLYGEAEQTTAMKEFERLGRKIVNNDCPWVSNALGGVLLSALLKKAQGNDARPVTSQDRDNGMWDQAATRAITALVHRKVVPHQLAVGVPGGCQVKVWGFKLMYEEGEITGIGQTFHKEDEVNAHSAFDRPALVSWLREESMSDPEYLPILKLTENSLRLEQTVYHRTTTNGTGLKPLCKSSRGSGQGNPKTNIIYPLTQVESFRLVEELYHVTVRSIQDDLTLAGRAEVIYGKGKALEFLRAKMLEMGNVFHPTKKRAFGTTQQQRDLIPPDVVQDFRDVIVNEETGETVRAYGMEICGGIIGQPMYVKQVTREKSQEIADTITSVAEKISAIDAHCSNAITSYSLQTKADFLTSVSIPTHAESSIKLIDAATEEAFTSSNGINLLDKDLNRSRNRHAPPVQDPGFTADRARIRRRHSGGGMRPQETRVNFFNSLCKVAPMMIDRKDSAGETIKGYFPMLVRTFGEGSFDEDKEESREHRFKGFIASAAEGNTIAQGWIDSFNNGKELHSSLINSLNVSYEEGERPVSFYDTDIEGVAYGIKNVSKVIMDERDVLMCKNLGKRAANLPATDARRQAFIATFDCPFASTLHGSLPTPTVRFSNREFQVSIAMLFGAPPAPIQPYVNMKIKNNPRCEQLRVDALGHNLTTITGCKGGGTYENHNGICRAISMGLTAAGIKHMGGAKDTTCKAAFSTAIPLGGINVNDTTSTQNLNSIVPDLIISTKYIEDTTPFGGADHLIDVKTLAAGLAYATTSTMRGHAVNTRSNRVSPDYHKRGVELDLRLHGVPRDSEERGPFGKILGEYGERGKVVGPVIGCYGEASRELKDLRDLIATEQGKRRTEYFRCTTEQGIGLHKHMLSRQWGHTIARGWAQLILSRVRDYVCPQAPGHHWGGATGGDNDVHAAFHFYNERGVAA